MSILRNTPNQKTVILNIYLIETDQKGWLAIQYYKNALVHRHPKNVPQLKHHRQSRVKKNIEKTMIIAGTILPNITQIKNTLRKWQKLLLRRQHKSASKFNFHQQTYQLQRLVALPCPQKMNVSFSEMLKKFILI